MIKNENFSLIFEKALNVFFFFLLGQRLAIFVFGCLLLITEWYRTELSKRQLKRL